MKTIPDKRSKPKDSSIRKAKQLLALARRQLYQKPEMPYDVRFSLRPLLAEWLGSLDDANPHHSMIRRSIEDYISEHPNLLESHQDEKAFLKEHDSTQLDFLFGSVFPPALSHQVLGYVAPAFTFEPFYITWGMFELLDNPDAEIEVEQYSKFVSIPFVVRACFIILNKVYGVDLDYIMPYLFKVKFGKTAPLQYYKTTSILDFLEVKMHREPPKISQEQIDFLLKNPKDAELWLSVFSPEIFYFEGVFVSAISEVTDLECMSRLRSTLLSPDSLQNKETIATLGSLINIYLKLSNTDFGIQAIDYPSHDDMIGRYNLQFPLIDQPGNPVKGENRNSVYETSCADNHIKIISDLQSLKHPRPIEQALIDAGYRSLILIPLRNQKKEIIGIMELGSDQPYKFNYVSSIKMKEILPLFDAAMEENREIIENRVRDIIQDKFTHIHPAVRWKFTSSAFDYLNAREDPAQEFASIQPPILQEVFPLFGQIDINQSSEIRSETVHRDLLANLETLATILNELYGKNKFHLLRKHLFDVNRQLQSLTSELTANLEADTVNQIREVNKLLRRLAQEDEVAAQLWINSYLQDVDPEVGTLNRGRSAFDQSVRMINRAMSEYFDQQEEINQNIIPHLFEKFQTDGIEYNIFVGQSILEDGAFGRHHLENLRLWQLKSMVEIQRIQEKIRPQLPLDLQLSYLIYVHDSPISIRFRLDEKRFDVDGTHDVRYEILKKRLDKALLKDRSERLTADGKIAIAFVQEKDKSTYREYIDYLIREGMLEPQVEEVEIEAQQGASGLTALRVKAVK